MGARVEADVVEFEFSPLRNGSSGGLATATYAPPQPIVSFSGPTEDDVTVEIRDRDEDARVVAVIEVMSPRNKDRPEARRGFAAKLVDYLRRGAGLVVLDVITNRRGTPHEELVRILELPASCQLQTATGLSAVAYQPVQIAEKSLIHVWFETLAVGSSLPTLPLSIRGFGFVPLDREGSYMEACRHSRLL